MHAIKATNFGRCRCFIYIFFYKGNLKRFQQLYQFAVDYSPKIFHKIKEKIWGCLLNRLYTHVNVNLGFAATTLPCWQYYYSLFYNRPFNQVWFVWQLIWACRQSKESSSKNQGMLFIPTQSWLTGCDHYVISPLDKSENLLVKIASSLHKLSIVTRAMLTVIHACVGLCPPLMCVCDSHLYMHM